MERAFIYFIRMLCKFYSLTSCLSWVKSLVISSNMYACVYIWDWRKQMWMLTITNGKINCQHTHTHLHTLNTLQWESVFVYYRDQCGLCDVRARCSLKNRRWAIAATHHIVYLLKFLYLLIINVRTEVSCAFDWLEWFNGRDAILVAWLWLFLSPTRSKYTPTPFLPLNFLDACKFAHLLFIRWIHYNWFMLIWLQPKV